MEHEPMQPPREPSFRNLPDIPADRQDTITPEDREDHTARDEQTLAVAREELAVLEESAREDVVDATPISAEQQRRQDSLEKIRKAASEGSVYLDSNYIDRVEYSADIQQATILSYLARYLDEGPDRVLEAITRDQSENPHLKGVTSIKEVALDNGETCYEIKVHRDNWRANEFGLAYTKDNVYFVASGYSSLTQKAIADHELYHMNHPDASERKTILESNIKRNTIISGIAFIEMLLWGFKNRKKGGGEHTK